MVDPGLAAVIAALVSLVLGLASVVLSVSESRRTQAREQRQRRAEAYVEVMRIVETRGLAIQDQMYNITERGDDPYDSRAPAMPRRELSLPERSDRAAARALLATYGSASSRAAFERWLAQVDAWETNLAGWVFERDLNGPVELSAKDAEPERSAERAARAALGEGIGAEVSGRPFVASTTGREHGPRL